MSSIKIERYTSERMQEWNLFNKTSKNSLFLFDRNYMDYHSDRFMDHSLMFFKEELLVALLPMNEKDGEFISHGGLTYGGFIVDDKMKQSTMLECVELLKDYSKENGIKKIIYKKIPHIFSDQPAEEDEYAIYKCGGRVFKVEPSTAVYLDNPLGMTADRKRKIKKALKEGVEIVESGEREDYGKFIEIQGEILETRHGARIVHTADEMYLLHSRFPEGIKLFYASFEGKMIGGTIVYEYDNAVHTQYMGANDIGRELGALDLAVSSVMDKYKGRKRWLDFGISSEDNGQVFNEGLAWQKEGFGGRTITYRTWELDLR